MKFLTKGGIHCISMSFLGTFDTAVVTHICMYVRMYGHIYSKSMDQPGKVANPARGQLNRKNRYGVFPCPRLRLRI